MRQSELEIKFKTITENQRSIHNFFNDWVNLVDESKIDNKTGDEPYLIGIDLATGIETEHTDLSITFNADFIKEE